MCPILFAHDMHGAYRLVVGANWDEFHGRATAPVAWWEDAPGVLAGRENRGASSCSLHLLTSHRRPFWSRRGKANHRFRLG
jgi:uncharacterized protein with NRDE domain